MQKERPNLGTSGCAGSGVVPGFVLAGAGGFSATATSLARSGTPRRNGCDGKGFQRRKNKNNTDRDG